MRCHRPRLELQKIHPRPKSNSQISVDDDDDDDDDDDAGGDGGGGGDDGF